MLERIGTIKGMMQGNPQALADHMMRSNPQFAQFVAQNRGKTPEQAFRDAGFDFEQVRNLL